MSIKIYIFLITQTTFSFYLKCTKNDMQYQFILYAIAGQSVKIQFKFNNVIIYY